METEREVTGEADLPSTADRQPPSAPNAKLYLAAPESDNSDAAREDDSRHVFYAVELFIFAFVGWGWLAIREYLGKTPVLDVVVVISIMVSSILNLAMAVALASSRNFTPFACAYFSHCAALWVLYVYGLAESLRSDADALCCLDQGSSYTIGPTYASAFFGGLPMHQIPAMITLAYLTVLTLIAGAQARVCSKSPREWLLGGSWISITSLVATHLSAFLMGFPVCEEDSAFPALTVLVAFSAVILTGVDLDWFMELYYTQFRDGKLKDVRGQEQRRTHRILRSTILAAGVTVVLLYCLAVASVVGKSLSLPLFFLFLIFLVASWSSLGIEAVNLYGNSWLGIKRWEPTIDSRAQMRSQRGRVGQDLQIPVLMTGSRVMDTQRAAGQHGPFLRRYPIFLQGQANRGKKSY